MKKFNIHSLKNFCYKLSARPFLFAASVLPVGLLVLGSGLPASTVYVQNPSARLLTGPSMKSGGQFLKKGEALQTLGQKGLFYQVRSSKGSGWVPRLYVSKSPPGKRVNFGSAVNRSTASRARARAANFSQTAAARGFSGSTNVRARGSQNDFDLVSIQWLEKIHISNEDLHDFARQGNLR